MSLGAFSATYCIMGGGRNTSPKPSRQNASTMKVKLMLPDLARKVSRYRLKKASVPNNSPINIFRLMGSLSAIIGIREITKAPMTTKIDSRAAIEPAGMLMNNIFKFTKYLEKPTSVEAT